MTTQARHAIDLLDFRRRVGELYRSVRESEPGADTRRSWSEGRDDLFSRHTQSPLEADDRRRSSGLNYFEHNPDWRFVLEVQPVSVNDVSAAHSSDGATALVRFGTVTLPVDGEPTLSVYQFAQYAEGIFLPFRDATSGDETYGGGRYLLDSPKGADLGHVGSRLVVDFNYAYHPSCVYSTRWSCPLPPAENWLTLPVPAGERL